MLATRIGDARLKDLFGAVDPRSSSVRPVVGLRRRGLSPVIFGVSALVAGALLFYSLNHRRTTQQQPAVSAALRDGSRGLWQAPPPLYIPPAERTVGEPAISLPLPLRTESAQPNLLAPSAVRFHARAEVPHDFPEVTKPVPFAVAHPQPRGFSGAALVVDHGAADVQQPGQPPILGVTAARPSSGLPDTDRIYATSLASPSLTVPEGYLIPAVLETGFDSTKPSFTRAIVSRDVRGFDGKEILIPRGSRLVGESVSPIVDGQKRAIITWTRLILPDGTTVNIDSPTADTVGRVGVQASVNTHILSRVGEAIGRTIVDLGRAFIGRSAPLVLLSGGEPSGQSRLISDRARAPTLKLAPGTSISVFVAHDLEFRHAAGQQ